MIKLAFVLSHYLAIALAGLVSYIFGRRLLWRVVFDSRLEQICFSLTLGVGVLAYLVLFLGLFGLLYSVVLAVAVLFGCASCYRVYIDWPRQIYLAIKNSTRNL